MRVEEILQDCARHPSSTLRCVRADGAEEQTSFAELHLRGTSLADRLGRAGLRPGHVIGIQADTTLDWVVWDLAAAHLRAVLRPYPSHHEFEAAQRIEADDLALLVSDRPAHAGAAHTTLLQPEAFVPAMLRPGAEPRPESDLHSIVYSSGTTGREKVLLISRKGAAAAIEWLTGSFHIGPGDRHIVFLPLANLQQRQQVFACLSTGVDITLCSYQRVMQAIRKERPTFLLAPPALYENMLAVAQGLPGSNALSDLFGGAVRFLLTGMAPIKPKVMKAYWDAGLNLLEAYGLTECGIIACNTLDRIRLGTVGPLLDPAAFSLSEEGEILIRQRHPLSLGYLGAEDLDQAVHRPDGKIATGDVGRLDADGFLILEGRVKDMIALPSGKKLHPADLEQMLLQLPGVEDAVALDNGGGVTAVLHVKGEASDAEIRAGLRRMGGAIDAAGALSQIIFTDMVLNTNPIFSTANMKLNRRLVGRHFLGSEAERA